MSFLTFRAIRKRLAPRWLTEGDGELVGYALDRMRDGFVQRTLMGLLARFPEAAPADALEALGRDRRVVRGLSETDAAYAARLLRWLDDRKRAGNPFALLQKLAEYTGPLPSFRTVDARGNWYSRTSAGVESVLLKQENWDWSGEPVGERWSRFWVIIYPNGLWTGTADDWGAVTGPDWGDPVDNAFTWGSTATHDQVATVRGIISDWKPAGTRCVNIILALDPASFSPAAPEPDGLWERWSKNVGGVQVPARLSTARYWDGVGA